ncbi:MAG: hypothetical protein IKP28_06145 [Clostridia bacterium]|nr:hypothetical protein [Clostridia bacterium]
MKKKLLFLGIISVALVILLAGCGAEVENPTISESVTADIDATEEEIEQKAYSQVTPTSDEGKEAIQDLELYSDSTKIVFANGQTKMVFTYNGDEITGYMVYIDYENATTAAYALTLIDGEDDSIEKAYVSGNYLVIEYAKSEYENLTVDDVRRAYSYLKEATK